MVKHVDINKQRVFLSLRRATPNPLLETLDQLVSTASAAAAAAPAAGGSVGSAPAPAAAAVDLRPTLGDLREAERFAELLAGQPGVVSAQLGVRLQSQAASQELELYMGRQQAPGEAAAAAGSDVAVFTLVLRKEQSVQEVVVTVAAALGREEVRRLAAAAVAAVVEAEAPS